MGQEDQFPRVSRTSGVGFEIGLSLSMIRRHRLLGQVLSCGEGTVASRFASADATWQAYINGFGPVIAVAASLDAARREEMRQAFNDWTERFRTPLGIAIPIEYLVTIGYRG
jgi:hypothetical protein